MSTTQPSPQTRKQPQFRAKVPDVPVPAGVGRTMIIGVGVVAAMIGGSWVWQNLRQQRKEEKDARHMSGGIPTWQYRIFQVNNPELVSHLPKGRAGAEQNVRAEQVNRPVTHDHKPGHDNLLNVREKSGDDPDRQFTQPHPQRVHSYDKNLVYTKAAAPGNPLGPVNQQKSQPNPSSQKNPAMPSENES